VLEKIGMEWATVQVLHKTNASLSKLTGRSGSVVRVSQTSAQAAQARHQRARHSPLLPDRSESVVRVV
jgi:hypothetical protein